MENAQSFQARVRQKIVEHEFHPICIEHAAKLANARKYEQTFKAKNKHRKWHLTEHGIECERKRGERYREKNKDNPEWRKRKNENSARCYRKKRTNALWMLFTYDPE